MKHSLKEQISAIQDARNIVGHINDEGILHMPPPSILQLFETYEALNDAASSIAALNLNPNIFERVKELEEALREIINARENSIQTKDLFYALKAIEKAKALLTNK